MTRHNYLTAPVASNRMPAGIPYILTNEAAERFSFYGMSSLLAVFMTQYLLGPDGKLATMSDETTTKYFHLFKAAAYFTPILGALLSDIWLGKFRTVIGFSLPYLAGMILLACNHTRLGLAGGLILIALGSGMIKAAVQANVGDQFGQTNKHLLSKTYAWFYFFINLGAAISMWICPGLLKTYGPGVGFGVPAAFMLVAIGAFWAGRRRFVHIPPSGRKALDDLLAPESLRALGKLLILYIFIAMFWALFEQSESAWVLQARELNLTWLGIQWLPARLQAVNPVLILVMIPLFTYVVYPAINTVWHLTPLRKIGLGLFLGAVCFCVPALIEVQIAAGHRPSIGWQFLAYFFLTAAEIMISITALEFSYTQAPVKIKSFVSCFYLISISVGNLFTAIVNAVIEDAEGNVILTGASYYWFFTITMLVTAVLFIPAAKCYPVKEYIQDEEGS